MKFSQKQKDAYHKAALHCSRYEKSSNKIRQKLTDWGLDENEVYAVIEKLIDEKYIDDQRYANSFVRDKFRFNKWGRIKIAFLLKADRMLPSIIEKALEEIEEKDYLETLKSLLVEKAKKTKAVNQYDKKAKLFRFAQSRGFESELIFKVIDQLLAK